MGAVDSPRPTDAELAILNVLWAQGACTVRDVHERLSQERDMGYTTVLKLMQIMFDKGLVTRDDSQRSHVYKARQKEQTTQRMLITDLLARAFGGSTEKLVMQALAARKASKDELAEIRRLLDELEGGAP
jgi:BlaI family penicillinase repressor